MKTEERLQPNTSLFLSLACVSWDTQAEGLYASTNGTHRAPEPGRLAEAGRGGGGWRNEDQHLGCQSCGCGVLCGVLCWLRTKEEQGITDYLNNAFSLVRKEGNKEGKEDVSHNLLRSHCSSSKSGESGCPCSLFHPLFLFLIIVNLASDIVLGCGSC